MQIYVAYDVQSDLFGCFSKCHSEEKVSMRTNLLTIELRQPAPNDTYGCLGNWRRVAHFKLGRATTSEPAINPGTTNSSFKLGSLVSSQPENIQHSAQLENVFGSNDIANEIACFHHVVIHVIHLLGINRHRVECYSVDWAGELHVV